MKFKSLLIESMIENLNINKFDKGIIKLFHSIKEEKNTLLSKKTGKVINSWDLSDGEKILKVSEILSYNDYDHLIKVYKFYKNYSNILFNDIDIEKFMNENPYNFEKDENFVLPILMHYYHKNYIGSRINIDGFEFRFDSLLDSVEEMIVEEIYTIELYNVDMGDNFPVITIYTSFVPNKKNGKYGSDIISHDEGLSEWNGRQNGLVYEEVIAGKYLNISNVKDLREESIKTFFDDLISETINFVKPNLKKIHDYMEWVNQNQPPR